MTFKVGDRFYHRIDDERGVCPAPVWEVTEIFDGRVYHKVVVGHDGREMTSSVKSSSPRVSLEDGSFKLVLDGLERILEKL